MPPKCFGLQQQNSTRALGRFALTVESTKLLGQVIRHVEASAFGDQLHDEEALLLDGALKALVSVVQFEGESHDLDVMNQTSMCTM